MATVSAAAFESSGTGGNIQLIVRHPQVFYDARSLVVPSMVNAIFSLVQAAPDR